MKLAILNSQQKRGSHNDASIKIFSFQNVRAHKYVRAMLVSVFKMMFRCVSFPDQALVHLYLNHESIVKLSVTSNINRTIFFFDFAKVF